MRTSPAHRELLVRNRPACLISSPPPGRVSKRKPLKKPPGSQFLKAPPQVQMVEKQEVAGSDSQEAHRKIGLMRMGYAQTRARIAFPSIFRVD
jgi:hypothetical protein